MYLDKVIGVMINDKDNVATIFNKVDRKQVVEICKKDGSRIIINSISEIPYGHKIAVNDIKRGEKIIKYGEEIGIATQDIKIGDYVHIHNLESKRGRGDWPEEVLNS